MKFLATSLLLAGSIEATRLATGTKSQSQMMAEIEAMSMNANMHQVSMREKTLIKTYLEVDMNEFLQQKMDSELFEEIEEGQKAQFVGNFFHFVKCRFQDCNMLAQTKSKSNVKASPAERKASQNGTYSKGIEDKKDLDNWGSGKATHVSAHNKKDKEPTLVQIDASADKAKMVTNTAGEVAKELEKEKADELVKPHAKADNNADTEPTNVQLKDEVKK